MFLNLFSLPRGCWLQAHLTPIFLFAPVVEIRFLLFSDIFQKQQIWLVSLDLLYSLGYLRISFVTAAHDLRQSAFCSVGCFYFTETRFASQRSFCFGCECLCSPLPAGDDSVTCAFGVWCKACFAFSSSPNTGFFISCNALFRSNMHLSLVSFSLLSGFFLLVCVYLNLQACVLCLCII